MNILRTFWIHVDLGTLSSPCFGPRFVAKFLEFMLWQHAYSLFQANTSGVHLSAGNKVSDNICQREASEVQGDNAFIDPTKSTRYKIFIPEVVIFVNQRRKIAKKKRRHKP